MSAQRQLNELAERRELLLLEADLHRSVITLERASLQARLVRLKDVRRQAAAGGPWLLAGSAVVGLLGARKLGPLAKLLPSGIAAWRWVRKLYSA